MRYMLHSQYTACVFTPNTTYNEIHSYADVPAPTAGLPVASMRPGHPQRGRGARHGQNLAAASRLWDAPGSPSGRSCAAPRRPRERRERGGHTAALRGAGGGWRAARTSPALVDAAVTSPAARTRTQPPGVAATAPPAVAAAMVAALSNGIAAALRRPERLRGAVSRVVRVMRDQAVRETPPSASQGRDGEC